MTEEPPPCVHHWMLEGSAPRAKGRCRKCRARREFSGGNDVSSGTGWAGVRDAMMAPVAMAWFERDEEDER